MAMEINRSLQFEKFVTFAQDAMDAGEKKAVARIYSDSAEAVGDTAPRQIQATKADKAFALFRSRRNKEFNDDVRELFEKSVGELFGGKNRIPPAVREAMLMKDYHCGKPLTARRIMAVQKAILEVVEPVTPKVSRQAAATAVNEAVERINAKHQELAKKGEVWAMPVNLSQEQLTEVTTLVEKYGKNLTEKGLGLLANFAVNAMVCPNIPNREFVIQRFAKDCATYREFPPGSPRFSAMDDAITKYSQEVLDGYMDPSKSGMFDADGLFNAFIADAPRNDFVINGQAFNHLDGSGPATIAAFKNAIRPEHRKALSTFFNQMPGECPAFLSQRMPLPSTMKSPAGKDLTGVKGFPMLVSNQGGFDDPVYMSQLAKVKKQTYYLNVSEDGKRTKIAIESRGDITFMVNEASEKANNHVGSFQWRQEFTFDTSGPNVQLIDAKLGQTFNP